eukprot:85121-Hanusia_phi.AAC.5
MIPFLRETLSQAFGSLLETLRGQSERKRKSPGEGVSFARNRFFLTDEKTLETGRGCVQVLNMVKESLTAKDQRVLVQARGGCLTRRLPSPGQEQVQASPAVRLALTCSRRRAGRSDKSVPHLQRLVDDARVPASCCTWPSVGSGIALQPNEIRESPTYKSTVLMAPLDRPVADQSSPSWQSELTMKSWSPAGAETDCVILPKTMCTPEQLSFAEKRDRKQRQAHALPPRIPSLPPLFSPLLPSRWLSQLQDLTEPSEHSDA